MRTVESLKAEFDNLTLITIFEMPVTNLETGEEDWITWDIEQHRSGKGLTARASEDLLEDYVFVKWDDCFSLDEHLQELYEKCYTAVCEDDFWDHREEN